MSKIDVLGFEEFYNQGEVGKQWPPTGLDGNQIVEDDATRKCCAKDLKIVLLRIKCPKESVKVQWVKAKAKWHSGSVPPDVKVGITFDEWFGQFVDSGHAFLFFPETGQGFGFYPGKASAWRGEPGKLVRDDKVKPTHRSAYDICPVTEKIIKDTIRRDWKSANIDKEIIYDYKDFKEGDNRQQCVTWAVETLRKAGIKGLPPAGTCLEPMNLKHVLDMTPSK